MVAHPELVFDDVTKIFAEGTASEALAVDRLSLSVEKGKLVTLLGPSGCGKTTTLRLIAGFEFPTRGTISLAGRRIEDVPPQRRDSAMVFQSYGLFPHMTVSQNVAYGLQARGVSRRDVQGRVEAVLERVGLEGLGARSTGALSGGQQQRVALARALVIEPALLLFDEPLSNLDAKLRKGTREQIRTLQQDLGITSVYVTHDQEEAMTISDEVVVMNEGRIEQVGPPRVVYSQPRTAFVADFIGDANFLPGVVKEVNGRTITVELLGTSLTVEQEDGFRPGDEVLGVIRPEAVDLVDVEEGDVSARVRFYHYAGSLVTYTLDLAGGEEMDAEVFNPQERGLIDAGSDVGVRLHRRSLHLLPK